MAKKRSMPHGRAVPKAKKAKTHTNRPVDADMKRQDEGARTSALAAPPWPPPTTMAPRSALRTSFATRAPRGSAPGLSTDYRYVISDLKRIAVLAGATFAVLFGLTFVIR